MTKRKRKTEREPLSNMGMVCKDCARKPDPHFSSVPLKEFIGRYCKLAFPSPDGQNNEYMWVDVLGLAETEGEELRGELNNHPVVAVQFQWGDILEFSRSEIIEVCD